MTEQLEAGKLLCSKTALKRCTSISISERESSPLWLPLNTGKSFCRDQRGAGEPTCCTRLVSIAMGSNKYWPSMLEYLSSLRAAASSASRAAPATYESANGQVTVTSQHSALPLCHGTSVRPSGRFPSVRNSPVGSLVTGKPAEAKLRSVF